jgi:peptidoglycan-associated lipoprotein
LNKTLAAILMVLTATFLLAGCPSKPVVEKTPETGTQGRAGAGVDTSGLVGRDGLPPEFSDPSSPLYQRVIYFDYDRSDILPQFVEVLRAHSHFLATNPKRQVTLEGHTDERGTREYNLALGDQRTDTVRRYMLAEGVGSGQINTLSYGEERPADPGHNETAWSLNRRVELVY